MGNPRELRLRERRGQADDPRRSSAFRARPAKAVACHVPFVSQYAVSMEPVSIGELVKVAGSGPEHDGIVFDTPSKSKVVVAVVDPGRGPVLRTVHPKL